MQKYLVSYVYTRDYEHWDFSRESVFAERGRLSGEEVAGFEDCMRLERNAKAVCVIGISPLENTERRGERINKPKSDDGAVMGPGEARAVFEMIGEEGISDEKKAEAVRVILSMPTHNSVSKDSLLEALRWAMERR